MRKPRRIKSMDVAHEISRHPNGKIARTNFRIMNKSIGTLRTVDLRNVWEHEAHNFTPWLAEPENLQLLGDAVGMQLEPISEEEPVGPFRADILCRDVTSDSLVLVENQLEKTDHSHLGQVITYAAGLDVATIIWVAKSFTDEHRAALEWLNNKTSDGLSFIGAEIEAWQIDDSAPALRFNIVEKPNEWIRQIKQSRQGSGGRKLWDQAESYWDTMLEQIPQESDLRTNSKPTKLHDIRLKVSWKDFWLKAYLSTYSKQLGVWVAMRGPCWEENYNRLIEHRVEIETAVGRELDWNKWDNHASANLYLHDADPKDASDWSDQHKWLADNLIKLYMVFKPYIESIELESDSRS